jgi:hypothetical protein
VTKSGSLTIDNKMAERMSNAFLNSRENHVILGLRHVGIGLLWFLDNRILCSCNNNNNNNNIKVINNLDEKGYPLEQH